MPGLIWVAHLERGARDGADEIGIFRAPGFVGRHDDDEIVAEVFAFEGFFEAREHATDAVEIDQWLASIGGVEHFAFGIGERECDGHNLIFSDRHDLL